MPAQPAWFHRLDEILSALRSMASTHLDRAAVEKLFRVRRRRARQIMAGLEGLRVGNAAADVRERRLEDLSAGIALRPGELRVVFSGAPGGGRTAPEINDRPQDRMDGLRSLGLRSGEQSRGRFTWYK